MFILVDSWVRRLWYPCVSRRWDYCWNDGNRGMGP